MPRIGSFTSGRALSVLRKKLTALVASSNLLPVYSTATLLWSVSNPDPSGIFPDNDDFGAAVVVGDTWVAVGAPYEPAGKSSGAGGVYILNTTSGSLSTTISNPDSPANGTYYDQFGSTMVKTPDSRILFVAAIGEDPSDVANTNYGIVYAFDTSNWSLKYSISPSTTDQYLYFGSSMAADNYHIAIAEPSSNLVRIFEAESGTQVAFIQNPNVQSGASTADYFGNSLYISSSTLVVGVPYEDSANSSYFAYQDTGGIVVYNWQTSTSTYVNYIPNPGGSFSYNTYFGSYMTGDNNKLYVSDRVSTIYSFDLSTITTPSVSPSTQTSAISIANAFNSPTVYPWKVAGDTLFFGNNVLPGSSYSGRVYALNTSTLETKFVIENPNTRADTTSSDNFGYSLDVNGNLLVVGAMENVNSSSSGTVYFFRLE